MSQIKVEYLGDLRTQSIHIDSGHQIMTDAPKDNQGLGRKFSPTDMLASSLGSCLLTIMGIVAKRHEIDMTGSTANVKKSMSESPRRISSLVIDIHLNETFDKKNKSILRKAAEHCPVHNSLSEKIDITINFN